jgi:hypothetical protein
MYLASEGIYVVLHNHLVLQEGIFLNKRNLLLGRDHGLKHNMDSPLSIQLETPFQH